MSQYDEFEIDLLQVFKALWKKIGVILLCTLVFAGAGLGYNLYTYVPEYAATATMYVNSTFERQYIFEDNSGMVTMSGIGDARNLATTCRTVLISRSVLEKVAEAANIERTATELSSMITAEAINSSEVFRITVTGTDPEEAAQIANAATQVLPTEMAKINSVYTVCTLDDALVPQQPLPNNIARNTVIAAFLGAMVVCVPVSIMDIWRQSQAYKAKSDQPA